MIAKRRLIPALVVVAGLACSATAIAQPNGRAWGWGQNRGGSQAAYDNGYRAGYDQGQADARGRDRYGYERARPLSRWLLRLRLAIRQPQRLSPVVPPGVRLRLRAGLQRAISGYGNGRATPRRDPGYGSRYPTYPSSGGYGGYGGGYYNEAYDRGMREGAQKGREDAKDGDRYDPRRHNWYRDGDRGYNNRYGSRDQYKAAYRDAFERGYAQGYREYGGRGGYNNGGFRWPW